MSNLITRLQSAPANDRDLFTEALDLCGPDHDHEWRQRVLLLIRDGAFLDAAMMFAVEGWRIGSARCLAGPFSEAAARQEIGGIEYESTAYTEANARLAVWLKVRGIEA